MSIEILAILAVPVLVAAWPWLTRRLRERRRARLRAAPLPAAWLTLLRRVPLYRRLPATLRARLHGDINVFLAEKRFYGQDGLEVTDTMRLAVAAQACLLQLNLRTKYYPDFTSILVYPDAFVAVETAHDGLLESTHRHVRSGESWYRGPVILSWTDLREDLDHGGDGHNVVLHEFAHKLDEQDGLVDGAPELSAGQARHWPSVFRHEYARLEQALARGEHTLLDPYAASAPAEFFAVAVETFFERAPAFERQHPELYRALADFFALDPARWSRRSEHAAS
ncbi:MAG: zinc-dependent peptidase [Gammaproteobacteria bacterium]